MAADPFVIKRNDLDPPFEAWLTDDGVPVDLSTASQVRFYMRNITSGLKVAGPMAVAPDQSADRGKVTYQWVAGDTDRAGTFNAEVEVRWPDGDLQTFPPKGYVQIKVAKDLGPTA